MRREKQYGHPRACAQCGAMFSGRSEHRNYAQRFCSQTCAKDNRSDVRRASWPTEEEMRKMVYEEDLADPAIGARYGHTYEWARLVRKAYGIPAKWRPPHREIKHGRYIGADKWSVAKKGDTCCRSCGQLGERGRGALFALHLHHVIPRSMSKTVSTDVRNGIALCYGCHSAWHDRRAPIYRDVFTDEEWAWLCAVPLLGRNTRAWLEDNYPLRPQEAKAA